MALKSYEDVLTSISTPSERFQIILFFLLSLSTLQVSFEFNMMPFNNIMPKFKCTKPVDVSSNSDQCLIKTNSSTLEKCKAWSYDKSIIKNSFAMDAKLLCDRAFLIELGDSMFFLAAAIGQMLGFLPDLFGRRKMLLFYSTWDIIICQLLPITSNIYFYFTFRFLRGISVASFANIGLCIITELLPTHRRSVYGANYWTIWSVGYASISGITYLAQDWRLLRYITCIPQVVYLFYWFFVPESPRWLSLKGRRDEAIKTFIRIGKFNGKTLTEEDFLEFDSPPFSSWEDFKNSLRCPKLMKRFVVACALQITLNVSYSGLSLMAKYASSNIYFSSLFSGVCELPSGLVAWFLCVWYGRKASLSFLLLLTTFCIVPVPWFQARQMLLVASIIAVIGKFSLATAYNINSVYVMELFPTTVRYTSSLFSSFLGSLIVISVPEINHLAAYNPITPNAIYGSLTFITALLMIFCMPETKDYPLSQIVSETSGIKMKEKEAVEAKPPLKKTDASSNECSNLIK